MEGGVRGIRDVELMEECLVAIHHRDYCGLRGKSELWAWAWEQGLLGLAFTLLNIILTWMLLNEPRSLG